MHRYAADLFSDEFAFSCTHACANLDARRTDGISDGKRTTDGADRGVDRLIGQLLYGVGLRLVKCHSLRVKDIDFDYGRVVVRNGSTTIRSWAAPMS